MSALNDMLHSFVWGMPMLALMSFTGVYFSMRTGFFQIFKFKDILKSALQSGGNSDSRTISPFQAMSTALAGVLGIGNILGVATAIAIGGPGVLFWMWVSAFLGMATKYAEIVLALEYRQLNKKGEYVGGPMYYIENGLKLKLPAVMFCVFCIFACLFGMGNLTQINATTAAVHSMTGAPVWIISTFAAVVVGGIISRGIKTTGKIMAFAIPVVSAAFIVLSIAAIAINRHNLPAAISGIFAEAFKLKAAAGGAGGYMMLTAMRYGFARGVFSNEAGLGSAPIVHAASNNTPVKQGLCGAFEVFFDTIVMATITGVMILCSEAYINSGANGANLATIVFAECFGETGRYIISASLLFFALASMPGWYYYGEKCMEYLTKSTIAHRAFRYLYIGIMLLSPVFGADFIWKLADTANGLMAVPNLFAILFLSGVVIRKTNQSDIRIRKKIGISTASAACARREKI